MNSTICAVYGANPEKVVRLRVEPYNLCIEIVWDGRCVKGAPRSASVRRIIELRRTGSKICAIAGIPVKVEILEMLSRCDLIPGVPLITRLPHCIVGKQNKNGLRVENVRRSHTFHQSDTHGRILEVAIMDNYRGELELRKNN
jgi:hypothetical protein